MKVLKGDTVVVIAGDDLGKTGTVLRTLPKKTKIIVEGINFVKRHTKARGTRPGGILEKEAPVHVSNVMVVCPKCNQRSKVRRETLADGRRVRTCKRCGEMLSSQ